MNAHGMSYMILGLMEITPKDSEKEYWIVVGLCSGRVYSKSVRTVKGLHEVLEHALPQERAYRDQQQKGRS